MQLIIFCFFTHFHSKFVFVHRQCHVVPSYEISCLLELLQGDLKIFIHNNALSD